MILMATINISKIKKEIDKYKNKKKEIILAVHMEQGRNLKVLL
jgi:glycerol-3-phosphate responsive antiterminator